MAATTKKGLPSSICAAPNGYLGGDPTHVLMNQSDNSCKNYKLLLYMKRSR
ncbi:hypothetical protein P3S68_014973 [Capsicum galapagoense]